MQGRQGQGSGPWDKSSSRRIASLNGTGKQPSIPQRPPGMARVSQPPATPRIARPKREAPNPGKFRRRLLIVGSVFLVCALLACFGSYIAFNFFSGLNASSGASTVAVDFLSALSKKDYAQAYKDLGPAITLSMPQDQFERQAQSADTCFGAVKDYSVVEDGAKVQGTSQTYTFSVTREKTAKPYQLQITLQQQQDPGGANTWKVTNYGSNLGPSTSSNTCK